MAIYTPEELREMPDLCIAQCCTLKVDTGDMRVWLCRVSGGVTIERLKGGRWVKVAGDCTNTGDES